MRKLIYILLLVVMLGSLSSCRTYMQDSFAPKPHRYETGFKFDPRSGSVKAKGGGKRGSSRESFGAKRSGGKSGSVGGRSNYRDSYSSLKKDYRGGKSNSRTGSTIYRDSYSSIKQGYGKSGSYDSRQRRFVSFGGFASRGAKGRDSYSARSHTDYGRKEFNSSFDRVVSKGNGSGFGKKNSVETFSKRSSNRKGGSYFSQTKGRSVSRSGFFATGMKRDRDSFSARKSGDRGGNRYSGRDSFSKEVAKRSSSKRYSEARHRMMNRGGISLRGKTGGDSYSAKNNLVKSHYFAEAKGRKVGARGGFYFRPAAGRERFNDSFGTRRKGNQSNLSFNQKEKRVLSARSVSGFKKERGRFRDSFASTPNGSRGGYEFNAKHRKVQIKRGIPSHEKEISSFGGRKLKPYKQYVFDAKSRQIKHRKGFFFRLFDRIQNRHFKPDKKKEKQMELWDPKMRRQMKGND